jgi:hypothetical protein
MPILFHTGKFCIDGQYIYMVYIIDSFSITNKIINLKKKKTFLEKTKLIFSTPE